MLLQRGGQLTGIPECLQNIFHGRLIGCAYRLTDFEHTGDCSIFSCRCNLLGYGSIKNFTYSAELTACNNRTCFINNTNGSSDCILHLMKYALKKTV